MRTFSLWVLLVGGLAAPAAAEEPWVELKTSHFQMDTDAGEAPARAALTRFERVRDFFLQSSPFAASLAKPVRIVAFRSEPEYRPYHPSESAASFYTRDNEHDYIVMQDLDPEHFSYAVHEYTHLVIARSGLRLPLWMNEGWADLNSTLTMKGRKAEVGDVIAGRKEALTNHAWIPLTELDAVTTQSPFYNEREKASVFYGESWALTHMLFLAPAYRGKFDRFVRVTLDGQALPAACLAVFGKTAAEVQRDLAVYIGSGQLFGAVFDYRSETKPQAAAVTPFNEVETGLLLADLLTLTHKFAEAQEALERLAAEHPDDAAVAAAMGYLALKTGDRAAGLRGLKKAYELGSKDAVLCYRLAVLLHATSPDRGTVIALLRRALELQPGYGDARLQLGVTLLESGDFAGSLSELRLISNVTEANALWYYTASAIDNAKLGHAEEASRNASLARKAAKTPAQLTRVEQMLQALHGKPASAQ